MRVLRRGLRQWGGSARPTPEVAIALGFESEADLYATAAELRRALAAVEPLTALDWKRARAATELVFASDVLGAGVDWSTVTGLGDEETVRHLRALQRALSAATAGQAGWPRRGVGGPTGDTRPP